MLIICQVNAKPELFDLKKVLDTAIRNYLLENFEKSLYLFNGYLMRSSLQIPVIFASVKNKISNDSFEFRDFLQIEKKPLNR